MIKESDFALSILQHITRICCDPHLSIFKKLFYFHLYPLNSIWSYKRIRYYQFVSESVFTFLRVKIFRYGQFINMDINTYIYSDTEYEC